MDFGSIIKILGVVFGALANLGVGGWLIGKVEKWLKTKKLVKEDMITKIADYARDAAEDWGKKKALQLGEKISGSEKFNKAVSIVEKKAGDFGIKLPTNEIKEAVGAAVTRMNLNPR